MFAVYLYYYYKFIIHVCPANISLQHNKELVKIAIAMGSSVGAAYFIVTILAALDNSGLAFMSGSILLLIQQAVIMTSFISTKKIFGLCKAYF